MNEYFVIFVIFVPFSRTLYWVLLSVKLYNNNYNNLPPARHRLISTSQSLSSNSPTEFWKLFVTKFFLMKLRLTIPELGLGGSHRVTALMLLWSLKVNIDWWIRIAMTNGYFIFNMSGSGYNAWIHCVWWKDIIHSMHIQHTIHTHLVLPSLIGNKRVHNYSIESFTLSIVNWIC